MNPTYTHPLDRQCTGAFVAPGLFRNKVQPGYPPLPCFAIDPEDPGLILHLELPCDDPKLLPSRLLPLLLAKLAARRTFRSLLLSVHPPVTHVPLHAGLTEEEMRGIVREGDIDLGGEKGMALPSYPCLVFIFLLLAG